MNEDNEIEIVLEEDKKPEGSEEIVAKGNDELTPKAEDVAEKLRKQVEDEKKLRLEAEERARNAERTAAESKGEVQDTQLSLIEGALNSRSNEKTNLKEKYRDALATGDYDAAADINEKMTTLSAQILQLEAGRDRLKSMPKVSEASHIDPVERMANQLSARSASWIRNHPQFANDPRLNQKLIGAHNMAVADGIRADSDEYFERVEELLGINKNVERRENEGEEQESHAAKKIEGRRPSDSAPPAAAPSRSAPSNGGNKPNVVRLSRDEREMAQMMGMTDQEYAKNKVALQREGKLH